MKFLEKNYSDSLKLLGITLPKVDQIPYVRFDEAKELVSEKYQRKSAIPMIWNRKRRVLLENIFRKNTAQILFLSPTIHRKNVLFTPWMIRKIPDLH